MHGANAHYGHRAILTAYAGMADGTPLPGLLQHGWNHDLGATLTDVRIPAPAPFYAWSERNLRHCRKSGQPHVTSFGSPFLYLPPVETPAPEPGSLFAIPVHSWEREQIPHDFQAYAQSLAALQTQFRKVTVCLYWFDHQFPSNREPFEALGMEVVTAGHRDDNPAFLHDLRKLLLRHEFVTSNRAQTGLFYGLALGRKGFLYGPPMGLDGRFDHSGDLFDAWQSREFPDLLWDRFQGDARQDIGQAELGLQYRLEPEALRELLRWQPDQHAELERTVQAFRIRQSRGIKRLWFRLSGKLQADLPAAVQNQGVSP